VLPLPSPFLVVIPQRSGGICFALAFAIVFACYSDPELVEGKEPAFRQCHHVSEVAFHALNRAFAGLMLSRP
jgi:hypothetical protein